ncbi:hypothetical protein D3C72_1795630 [compost metagenome]
MEPAPSATLLAPVALVPAPIATALLPLALAVPSTAHLSTTLLLSTTQFALPPISTDCAEAMPVIPSPIAKANAAASRAGAASVALRRWSTTPPDEPEEASSEATTN